MVIANKFDAVCAACGNTVHSGEGYAHSFSGEWYNYHSNCLPEELKPSSIKQDKSLVVVEGKGQLYFPFNPAHVALVKTIPNRSWNKSAMCWEFPLEENSLSRALEVARLLNLQVPDDLQKEKLVESKCEKFDNLFDYQKLGADFLCSRSAALLGDEMGTGKTPQSLCALPSNKPVLIISPSCVKFNWVKESNKWRPDYRVSVICANKTKTDYEADIIVGKENFRLPEENEILIVNREMLPDFLVPKKVEGSVFPVCDLPETFKQGLNKTYIIVDEAHQFKGTKTAGYKKLKTLSRGAAATWALTGTPLMNRPMDLWGVLSACNMEKIVFNRYGLKPYDLFYESFNGRQGRFGTEWGCPTKEVPDLIARVRLARKRKDVLPQLPDKMYTNVAIEIDDKTGDVIKKKMNMLQKEFGSSFSTNNLPPFESFSAIRAEIARSRIPALVEYVEECEEQEVPLVVFSAHLDPLNVLRLRDGWAVIDGSTVAEDRQTIVDAFQSGKLKGVACTIKAGGVGITLTHAWKCLFVDLDWVPANNQQAEDRICRIGQQSNKVEIIRFFMNHPLDKRLLELLSEKQDLIKKTFDKSETASDNIEAPVRIQTTRTYPEIVCDYEASRCAGLPSSYSPDEMQEKINRILSISKEEYLYSLISQTDIKAIKKLSSEFADHPLTRQTISFILTRYDRIFSSVSCEE